jgi:hypothetical protein
MHYRMPCKTLALALLTTVPMAASAEMVELDCQITSTLAFNHAGQKNDSSQVIQQRYTIDTEAKTVIQHFGQNQATKKWEENPKFITDVRSVSPKMVVFCDNDQTKCVTDARTGNEPAYITKITATPVMINLEDNKVTFSVHASRTHLESGDWLTVDTSNSGTCTRR